MWRSGRNGRPRGMESTGVSKQERSDEEESTEKIRRGGKTE